MMRLSRVTVTSESDNDSGALVWCLFGSGIVAKGERWAREWALGAILELARGRGSARTAAGARAARRRVEGFMVCACVCGVLEDAILVFFFVFTPGGGGQGVGF